MKIRQKIFYFFLITSVVLTSICIFIQYYYSAISIESQVESKLTQVADDKTDRILSFYNERKGDIKILATSPSIRNSFNQKLVLDVDFIKKEIRGKADEAAGEISDYIKNNPDKTLEDLQKDENFSKIAVQKVGITGYTTVADYNSLICRFHKNSDFINLNLESLSDILPEFWKIILKSKGGNAAEGFYDWSEPDGSFKRKYMYISIVDTKTADNIGLLVAATTYLDDYGSTMEIFDQSKQFFKGTVQEFGYEDLYIIDTNGNALFSLYNEDMSGINVEDEYYIDSKLNLAFKQVMTTRELVLTDFENFLNKNEFFSFLASPVFSEDKKELLGVVVLVINKAQINDILLNTSNKDITNAYLVGADYLMRSDSSLIEYSTFLKQKVDNEAVKECFSNKDNTPQNGMLTLKDFTGNKVLSVYKYIPSLNWCLISQTNRSQALNNINRMLWHSIFIWLLIFFMFYLFTKYFSDKISKPIADLQNGIHIVTNGNLNYQVSMKTGDEIGDLSVSFDKMTKAIRKSNLEVERKVKIQTKEINQQKKSLENQHNAILNVLEDIELEKENVEKERDKINAILHSIGESVIVINKKGQILVFNDSAKDITGFSLKEVIGKQYKNLLRFVDQETGKIEDDFIEHCMQTGELTPMKRNSVILAKDGKFIPVADSAAPLITKDGTISGCVVVFSNVTKEREIDRAKTEFVSLASHQLRTPLNAISWYAEMLLNGDAGKIGSEQKEFLDQISISNKRMIDLVDSLLNVSRLELGTFQIDISSIKLQALASSVIKELRKDIVKKKLNIKENYNEDIPVIKYDERLMRMVFQNLISNAVKYTSEGGDISVEIMNREQDIFAVISDTGYGIPKDQQSRLFSKMFRASNVQKKGTEGTGLGLYIVKSIIENMGGKIWFESEENKGTKFNIIIPKSIHLKKEA